jgi:2-keto-4-pentenoate hydratase
MRKTKQDGSVEAQIEAEASELISLRRGREGNAANPPIVSPLLSAADAYGVQARVLHQLNESVGGWKVAMGPEGQGVAAPLFASTILPSRSTVPIAVGMKIETELAFKLKCDLPARQAGYTRQEILNAISTVQCAFEIIRARHAGDKVAFAKMLADNLANDYTVLAGESRHVDHDLDAIGATIERGGVRIASGRHPAGDPLLPILQYANRSCDQLGGLRGGQVVITGSFTGALPVEANSQYIGTVGSFDPVVVSFR